jgi:hypothetical protein
MTLIGVTDHTLGRLPPSTSASIARIMSDCIFDAIAQPYHTSALMSIAGRREHLFNRTILERRFINSCS